MTVYFCQTEHHYQSYDDWYRLAELSGYEVIPISQMDVLNPDHVYIVNHFGAVGMPGNEHEAKARIVLWQLEWAKAEDKGEYPPNIREIWASDKWFAEYYGARYVLLGSHAGLAATPPNPNGDKAFDVALMMYRQPYRRQMIINQLVEAGVSIAPDGWGEKRDKSLHASRCMLHIHQHDIIKTVAPLRFAIAAAYKLPLITERCEDMDLFDRGYVLSAKYQDYVAYSKFCLAGKNIHALQDRGNSLHNILCNEHTFRDSVESML